MSLSKHIKFHMPYWHDGSGEKCTICDISWEEKTEYGGNVRCVLNALWTRVLRYLWWVHPIGASSLLLSDVAQGKQPWVSVEWLFKHDDVMAWNTFRITGRSAGDSAGDRGFSSHCVSNVPLWFFSLVSTCRSCWTNIRVSDDLRRHCAHVTPLQWLANNAGIKALEISGWLLLFPVTLSLTSGKESVRIVWWYHPAVTVPSVTLEPVSAFSLANNPGHSNENPIWWRWHGNTKIHAIFQSSKFKIKFIATQ